MTSPKKRPAAAKSQKTARPRCPKCGNRDAIKSGMVQGEQRWKCKTCSYQYTRIIPRGRPLWQKSLVVFLYSYGVSMHTIARIFHVQPSTILKWVRSYARDSQPIPEMGDLAFLELKEMPRLLQAMGKDSNILCIAIDDATFKESMGITITKR
jgi:transposase